MTAENETLRNKAAIGDYLMASYLYYYAPEEKPIMSDAEYDKLAKYILKNWDVIEHKHKHLIDKDDLKAGTAFNIKLYDYPSGLIRTALNVSRTKLER